VFFHKDIAKDTGIGPGQGRTVWELCHLLCLFFSQTVTVLVTAFLVQGKGRGRPFGRAGDRNFWEVAMFVDRIKEDRVLASALPGVLDDLMQRRVASRFSRLLAAARQKLAGAGRELSCRLGEGKSLSLRGQRFCQVRCLRGAIWVTLEGEGRDRVLTPGQDVVLVQGGKLVITGRGELAEVTVRWD
jgi:hypothetical protein